MKKLYPFTVAVFLLSIQFSFAQFSLNPGNSNQLFTLTPYVGVGISTPSAPFHVKLDYGGWSAIPSTPSPIFKVNFTNQAYTDIEYLNVLSNGYTGIGTDAPADWLHVIHTDADHGFTLEMNSTNSANSVLSFAHNTSSYWFIGMDWSRNQVHDFYITHTGATTPDFFINESGQVAIGSNALAHTTTKLQVSGGNLEVTGSSDVVVSGGDVIIDNGTLLVKGSSGQNNFLISSNGYVRARQILVDLQTIPDYVFAKDYKMMSLSELEAYIQANKHLPNIPSAAEYAERGAIDMRELQLKMLEKIEELTLYVLELKKENELLKAEMQKH